MLQRMMRHIRRQPRATRESYAFGSAILVTGCIALVWATQLPDRLATIGSVNVVDVEQMSADTPLEEPRNPLPFSNFLSRMQAAVLEISGSSNGALAEESDDQYTDLSDLSEETGFATTSAESAAAREGATFDINESDTEVTTQFDHATPD